MFYNSQVCFLYSQRSQNIKLKNVGISRSPSGDATWLPVVCKIQNKVEEFIKIRTKISSILSSGFRCQINKKVKSLGQQNLGAIFQVLQPWGPRH